MICTLRRPAARLVCRAPRLFCATSAGAPDATRGFDVQDYAGLWKALTEKETWPSAHTISVVGPVGDTFARSTASVVVDELGIDSIRDFQRNSKERWQAVRLRVHCVSPDDFCAVHSRLRALPDAKAVT